MKIEEIEQQKLALHYQIQDLDWQISQKNIPEAQISSARQLTDLIVERDMLINKRGRSRHRMAELEQQRQFALKEKEQNEDQRHTENKRIGWIAIGASAIGTAIGSVLK